jgi:tetratricopeptide (TPR) repeat protein
MKDNWRSLVPEAAVIIFVTLAVYMPAFHNGFVSDDVLITKNPAIRAGDGLYRIWFTTELPDYYPLSWSVWWFQWRMFGTSATGYHVVNVVLHAINAVLVWIVLRRLNVPGAWLAGLVFAVHPVNVATAAWISEQKNTLSMLFYAVTILLYLRFEEKPRWQWYGLSLAAFLLALLSKTAVVMLPVVLLLLAWWQRGKIRGKDGLRTVPFFVLSLVLGLVTISFQHAHVLNKVPARADGFVAHLLAAGWVPWFYLAKALLPVNLAMTYPKSIFNPLQWDSYVPGTMLVASFALFWWKRRTWGAPLLFGLGYFLVMLFPVLGFIDQAFYRATLVADHWQYYSIVGVIALVVVAGLKVSRDFGRRGREIGVLVSVAILGMLSTLSWRRADIYRDDETLWLDNLTKNPTSWLANYNLGVAAWKAGRVEEAIGRYRQVLRLRPDYNDARNNLGVALAEIGDLDGAIVQFRESVRLFPGNAEAHNNLGLALARQGQFQQAVACYEEAVRLQPDYVVAHVNLANALVQLGRTNDAIRHYQQALRVRPDYLEARNALAQLGGSR